MTSSSSYNFTVHEYKELSLGIFSKKHYLPVSMLSYRLLRKRGFTVQYIMILALGEGVDHVVDNK